MLPRNRRLSRVNFLSVNKNGKRLKENFFWIKILPNNLGFNRFAIVTSTKFSKLAVVRNKLRRNIYKIVENISGGSDIIIFPQKALLDLKREELEDLFKNLDIKN